MQSAKQCLKLNKVCVLIACIHFVISLFTDRLIFEYVTWDFSNLTQTIKTIITFGCKVVFLLLLVGLWHGIFWFIKKADRAFVRFTLIYFALNLVLLVVTWPGIWRMDEFGLLSNAIRLQPVFWQNYLTSIFYIFSIMLIPCPSGVIIVQIIVNSLIVGYLLWQTQKLLEEKHQKTGWIIYLGYLPFFMLPVLDSNLYPMRMSVYAFLELLLVFILYRYKNITFQRVFMWVIAVLGAVVTVWRTEAFYYVIALPVIVLVFYYKKWNKKQIIKTIAVFWGVTAVLFVPQQVGNKLTSGNEYDLTSVVLPLVPLIEEASKHEDAGELLDTIDKVVGVEVALEGAREHKSGISLYWSRPDEFKRAYTDEQYRAFKKAYYQLILKYPGVFLKERFESFADSNGLLENTTELFTRKDVYNYDVFKTYFLSRPINDQIRTTVIKILEWRSLEDYSVMKSGYRFIYSGIGGILCMLIVCIACLMKKRWQIALLLAVPLAKVVLIFLTAPSRLFMYYYSIYLIGYAVAAFCLVRWLQEKSNNE